MEAEGSLQCSQVPATGLWPESDESSCLGRTKGSVQLRGSMLTFRNDLFLLRWGAVRPLAKHPSWRNTPYRLFATAY